MFVSKMKFLIFLFIIALLEAANCPNMCSNHGTCDERGSCNCFKGWTMGDCSLSIINNTNFRIMSIWI